MASLGYQSMEVLTDLPDELYTTIGMVVVQFSYLEWILNRIIYDLKGLSTAEGREQTFGRRVGERLSLLFGLVDDRGLTITVDRGSLSDLASKYEAKRNLLSHAIFVRDAGGTLRVRNAKRGDKWQPPGGKSVYLSDEPSGAEIDAPAVAGLAENIAYLNRAVEALWREIAPQLPDSRHGKI